MTVNNIISEKDMLEMLVTTLTKTNNISKDDKNYAATMNNLKLVTAYFLPDYTNNCSSCNTSQIKRMLNDYWVTTGKAEYENINTI